MLPNFLVIGAPRSGTSWIHRNFMKHPQVYVPKVKEVHFFDKDYDKGTDYYESVFSGWQDEFAVGETTPAYMHGAYTSRDIPLLIKQHVPDVKLIASLRNPVDRAYSRYLHSKARFEKNASLSFEEKLEDRPEFIQEGFYADQLAKYYEHFRKDQLLVLLYDDLVAAPDDFMKKIYNFIGVDPDFSAGLGQIQINASAGKNRLGKSRAMWLLSRSMQYVGLNYYADRIRKRNSVKIAPMDPATRRKLIDIYYDGNKKLEVLINRDLDVWNQ